MAFTSCATKTVSILVCVMALGVPETMEVIVEGTAVGQMQMGLAK
jgi:hypothetical protein